MLFLGGKVILLGGDLTIFTILTILKKLVMFATLEVSHTPH
jgi:hypothetical protein